MTNMLQVAIGTYACVLASLFTCSIDLLFLQILCVEGVEFEPFPTGLSLPPKAGPHTVILLGIPHSAGQLRING